MWKVIYCRGIYGKGMNQNIRNIIGDNLKMIDDLKIIIDFLFFLCSVFNSETSPGDIHDRFSFGDAFFVR